MFGQSLLNTIDLVFNTQTAKYDATEIKRELYFLKTNFEAVNLYSYQKLVQSEVITCLYTNTLDRYIKDHKREDQVQFFDSNFLKEIIHVFNNECGFVLDLENIAYNDQCEYFVFVNELYNLRAQIERILTHTWNWYFDIYYRDEANNLLGKLLYAWVNGDNVVLGEIRAKQTLIRTFVNALKNTLITFEQHARANLENVADSYKHALLQYVLWVVLFATCKTITEQLFSNISAGPFTPYNAFISSFVSNLRAQIQTYLQDFNDLSNPTNITYIHTNRTEVETNIDSLLSNTNVQNLSKALLDILNTYAQLSNSATITYTNATPFYIFDNDEVLTLGELFVNLLEHNWLNENFTFYDNDFDNKLFELHPSKLLITHAIPALGYVLEKILETYLGRAPNLNEKEICYNKAAELLTTFNTINYSPVTNTQLTQNVPQLFNTILQHRQNLQNAINAVQNILGDYFNLVDISLRTLFSNTVVTTVLDFLSYGEYISVSENVYYMALHLLVGSFARAIDQIQGLMILALNTLFFAIFRQTLLLNGITPTTEKQLPIPIYIGIQQSKINKQNVVYKRLSAQNIYYQVYNLRYYLQHTFAHNHDLILYNILSTVRLDTLKATNENARAFYKPFNTTQVQTLTYTALHSINIQPSHTSYIVPIENALQLFLLSTSIHNASFLVIPSRENTDNTLYFLADLLQESSLINSLINDLESNTQINMVKYNNYVNTSFTGLTVSDIPYLEYYIAQQLKLTTQQPVTKQSTPFFQLLQLLAYFGAQPNIVREINIYDLRRAWQYETFTKLIIALQHASYSEQLLENHYFADILVNIFEENQQFPFDKTFLLPIEESLYFVVA